MMSLTIKAYRDDIPDRQGGFMAPIHASPIYIHLSTKSLRLAVPRQELEDIDMFPEVLAVCNGFIAIRTI